jgi:hypothetical protein
VGKLCGIAQYGLLLGLLTLPMVAQDGAFQGFRPPAVPLIACDPYFSVWSTADHLTDAVTSHWTGKPQPLNSLIRIDGKSYRLMGREPAGTAALTQTSVRVLPTRTVYEFAGAGVQVRLTFMTPMLPDDLDVLARPVTYIAWDVNSVDGAEHRVALFFDAAASLAVNDPTQEVTMGRYREDGNEAVRAGSQEQKVLRRWGDDVRIDWGFLYVAAPQSENGRAALSSARAVESGFVSSGAAPSNDDLETPRPASQEAPALAWTFDLGSVGHESVSRYLLVAYDDLYSVEYLFRRLRPWWRRNGAGAADLIRDSLADYASLKARCEKFDAQLIADARRAGGDKYAVLVALAYRQSLAAQKLTADIDGTPYLFPKENFSNGCIGTVDVIYPQSPQLMLFSATLLKASLTPILEYARSGRWKFPFAPHDLGTYPLANGQVYGGGERSEEDQMPVEETANLLLLVSAVAKIEGNAGYAEKYWPLLEKWAHYLSEKGLDPENQLCTDDFAGHLAHNANLSIKAIEGLAAYSQLCERTRRNGDAGVFRHQAEGFASRWMQMAMEDQHSRLAFDRPGTWSQKYNLVWDKILGLHLFPESLARDEVAFYESRQNRYGLPLDSRKTYSKLDWVLWTATLADSLADFEALVAPLYKWANETMSRVPLTDWFDTVSGRQEGFQARSVVGGLFIKMVADKESLARWGQR